ncbi:MAG: DUF4249 family protein [Alphaproteobacteria bacterium]|nr:DUF4249 family protein [Alphaproteobacteria bacterium]
MMNNIRFILIILMSVLTNSSCVRDILMDAKEKPQVVVTCILSEDSVQTLKLSFTKGASLSDAPPLTDAVAVLFNDNQMIGTFERQNNGEWILDYTAVPGYKYRLEVQVPGYEMIYAEQQMPPEPAPIKIYEYTHFSGYIAPWSGWISIPWDPENPNGSIFWDTIHSWPEDEDYPDYETLYALYKCSTPIWLSAKNYNKETGRHETAELICTDASADMMNATNTVYEPLSKDEPNPYKLRDTQPGYPFEESFYNAHKMELYPTLKGKSLHKYFIRIPKDKPQAFYLSGSFTGEYCEQGTDKWGYADGTEDKGYILCTTVSEEYDKYLCEAYYYKEIQESSDLSTIYIRDNIYTNIVGGLGIFGAQISRKYPWKRTYTYVDSGVPRDTHDIWGLYNPD